MSRDRYKNTLGTAGCCPFDSPFPAIVVFLSARASTSFLSLLSLASSFFRTLSNSLPRYLRPRRIFLCLSYPFFFSFAALGPPTRREENISRICVSAYERVKARARARACRDEPYVGLMSAIMT